MIVELYNLTHILYLAVSFSITVGILVAAKLLVKSQKSKGRFLSFCAWITFVLHISIMWVEFLRDGSAVAYDNILFPIYFCNFSMYLLLAVACIKNKESRIFKFLATYAAYAGILGGLITVVYPDTYIGKGLFDWMVFKSMASHTTMTIGCAYLFLGGFVKIRVKNLISYAGGLALAGITGLIVNGVFKLCGRAMPNAMYLINPPIPDVPFLSVYVIAAMMLVLLFIFTVIWEQLAIKDKKERWYNNLKKPSL